jgi:hypothetical protein
MHSNVCITEYSMLYIVVSAMTGYGGGGYDGYSYVGYIYNGFEVGIRLRGR